MNGPPSTKGIPFHLDINQVEAINCMAGISIYGFSCKHGNCRSLVSFIEKKRPRTNSVMNEMVKQNKKSVVEVKLYISRVGIRKSING